MALVDVNIGDAVEPEVLEAGEYQVRCTGADIKTSQKGNQYVNLKLEAVDEATAEDIYHILMLPDGADPKQDNKRKLSLVKACEALGVDYGSGLNTDEFLGQVAWVILGVESDEEYGDKNKVKSFVKGA